VEDDLGAADVAIVGGGYSGTMLGAELARRGISSILIEASDREGMGTAFSTPSAGHLLNVIAGWMGASADRPDDFAKAVAAEGYQPDDFVPRRRYGEYLRRILSDAKATGMLTVVPGQAVSAATSGRGWSIGLAEGGSIGARSVAMALGNQPPDRPGFADGALEDLFINDPWSDEGHEALLSAAEEDGDILIIGTGLTMVDVVLSLVEAGHQGRITAVSRRGLMPRAHIPNPANTQVSFEALPKGSARSLMRWLRTNVGEAGWRAAVDSLRPHSQALWRSWSEPEQRRFLRHARPWWDIHRHRIAPEVAGRLKQLIQGGQVHIVAGRICSMVQEEDGLSVTIRRRGQPKTMSRHFALAVNCTGPLGSLSRSKEELLRGMFEKGLAQPDKLDLGVEVDARSRVVGAARAWALGPMTKGAFWEITAVPDIRNQVAMVAGDIAEELGR
jgi:uncharacterized NAD(P)/FAD-binding protein YdhS